MVNSSDRFYYLDYKNTDGKKVSYFIVCGRVFVSNNIVIKFSGYSRLFGRYIIRLPFGELNRQI